MFSRACSVVWVSFFVIFSCTDHFLRLPQVKAQCLAVLSGASVALVDDHE